MTVLVIGATPRTLQRIREIAPSGVDVVDEKVAEPDWMLVTTTAQRIDAIATWRLAPSRVLEIPEISSDLDRTTTDALRTVLVKIAGIGAWRPVISSAAVSAARCVVRRLGAADVSRAWLPTATTDEGKDTNSWPPSAAAWTSGPDSLLETRVAPPVAVGEELDERLRDLAQKRARRFARQRVHWERPVGGGSP
jgi:hypothetical protein